MCGSSTGIVGRTRTRTWSASSRSLRRLLIVAALLGAGLARAQTAVQVKAICAGGTTFVAGPADVGGVVVFGVRNCQLNGYELWRSDGTDAGTVFLRGFTAIGAEMIAYKGKVYFSANDSSGLELWSTDGTGPGTSRVADIYAGVNGSNPSGFVEWNGVLYFSAADASHGVELWRSDGTSAGTSLVADIGPGALGSSPTGMTGLPTALVFQANNFSQGAEPWRSDGTAGGTFILQNIRSGNTSSSPTNFVVYGTSVYFSITTGSGGELWKSDGSVVGTDKVMDLAAFLNPRVVNNLIVFRNSAAFNGLEPWRSNGLSGGTSILKDIYPGIPSSGFLPIGDLGGVLLASAADPTNGNELWKSDGTPGGTVLVSNLNPGAGASTPGAGTAFMGTYYFPATTLAAGRELWKTDGTGAGTAQVQDLNPGAASASPTSLVVSGPRVFFFANGGGGNQLWALAASCPSGQHLCGTACVSSMSVDSCGASCTPCPAGPMGTTTSCDGTTCGFTCAAGLKNCGDRCADACCATNSDCTTPPSPCHEAQGVCTGGDCTYPVQNGVPCDADGSRCTPNDRCQDGACVPDAAAVSCVQLACNDGACNPLTGDCDYVPQSGTTCGDDGCYAAGTCDAGKCSGALLQACPPSSDPCRVALCDSGAGACAFGNVANGTPCPSDDKCIIGAAACEAGRCTGVLMACTPSSECVAALCEPATGACAESVLPDGTPCALSCTTGAGTCLAGACDCPGDPKPDEDGCGCRLGAARDAAPLGVGALVILSLLALRGRVYAARGRRRP